MSEKLKVMAESVRSAYAAGEEDEQLLPRVLVDAEGAPVGRIGDGDLVIFYDIRGEREIELTSAFIEPDFPHFDTGGRVARFTTMIEYHSELPVKVAFPPETRIRGTMVETITSAGMKLSKVVESEKAIHLSYFLNGKREAPFPGEDMEVIESPRDVNNHDEKPEMASRKVADKVIEKLRGDSSVIVVNFANVDVLAHIENENAVIQGIEAVDRELGRVLSEARSQGVTALVTADHGSAEKWYYPDGTVDTGHTNSPVPFVLADDNMKNAKLEPGGDLTWVAPTVLSLLGLKKPEEMTGQSLVKSDTDMRANRLLLVILDGWGYSDDDFGNLVRKADTPTMDGLQAEYPFTTILASGEWVGMPEGKVGNSEAGHLHMGAGRRILSDRLRIDNAIAEGSFHDNQALLAPMQAAVEEGRPLHLLGIVSFYSSHGSVDHLYALLEMAKQKGVSTVYHHALLGRRGERPEAGARYIDDVERFCEKLGLGRVVTVMGRFWALDREDNWNRVEKAYRALADGQGVHVPDRS
ncbi:MAG: phosphoglycerate mutase (2,3-diphosphoglycerate-independent) [bacterium]